MQVEREVPVGDGHTIEFGRATWDEESSSVRNRYLTATGGFSPHSSSEMPIKDVVYIAVETLRMDLLSQVDTLQIIQAAIDSLGRRICAER
jgi:hypothetical protein